MQIFYPPNLIGEYGLIKKVRSINGAATRNVIINLLVKSGNMKRIFPTMIWRNFRLKVGYCFNTFSDIRSKITIYP